MEKKAFRLQKVIQKFPGFQLGPLDLELDPGVVMGYIGPNGSGKTTTIHCMVGLLKTHSGSIDIFGRPNNPYKSDWKLDVGYVGDKHVFYEKWSVEKNLKFVSRFYPNWSDTKALDLVKRFRLPLHKRAKDLSSGNRVKLSLISALAHSPRLLLLDEPTSGLDPLVRSELLDELFEVLKDGERTIFYSTHILADINRLVDELCFLDEGAILLRTSKEELMSRWRKISFKMPGSQQDFDAAIRHHHEGNLHQLVSYNLEKTLSHLKRLKATDIQEFRLSIDEVAVFIMKEGKSVAND
jgi:ABC-2 type transport system ATP-binding protein